MPFRLLEHTADIGLEATATTVEKLFIEAAHALQMVLGGAPEAAPEEVLQVEIGAVDREELLVNWLNELLFLLETRHFYLADLDITRLTATRLHAVLRGEAFDPDRHSFAREIKAVTHHQLRLEESPAGWAARVYLDL